METTANKRIKRVFTGADQVLHLWANQTQSDARSRNVYFKGLSCYSYGPHYELGRLVKHKGKWVALINTTGYSVTTSKHIYYAFAAVSHLISVSVDHAFNPKKSLKELRNSLLEELEAQFRRIRFDGGGLGVDFNFNDSELCKKIAGFNKRAKLFDIKPIKVSSSYKRKYSKYVKFRADRNFDLDAIKRLKAETRRQESLIKGAKEIEEWKSGQGPLTNAVRQVSPQIVRIKGDFVETSKGSEIALISAKQFLIDLNNKAITKGYKIEEFKVSKITKNSVFIGCHIFDKMYLESLTHSVLNHSFKIDNGVG